VSSLGRLLSEATRLRADDQVLAGGGVGARASDGSVEYIIADFAAPDVWFQWLQREGQAAVDGIRVAADEPMQFMADTYGFPLHLPIHPLSRGGHGG
jgi:hypothetical protein